MFEIKKKLTFSFNSHIKNGFSLNSHGLRNIYCTLFFVYYMYIHVFSYMYWPIYQQQDQYST